MSPERVLVALTGGPEGEVLLRRARRRGPCAGNELHSVYVAARSGRCSRPRRSCSCAS